MGVSDVQIEEITKNNENGIRYYRFFDVDSGLSAVAFWERNSAKYIAQYYSDIGIGSEAQTIRQNEIEQFKQILSTFKFTK